MIKINTAVIMAAGLGTRFGKMTKKIPKGFVEVGGKAMVVRSVETLLSCGIEKIIIGTGYQKEAYEELSKIYPQIECYFNERYAQTNSMCTLFNARSLVGDDDFILLESDLVFEQRAITSLQESEWTDVMLVSPVIKFQDQYYVECNSDNILTNCSVNANDVNYIGELVGIHKISNMFYKQMCADYASKIDSHLKMGYEFELQYMSKHIMPMHVLKVDGLKWYEIDDESDLAYAEKNIVQYL